MSAQMVGCDQCPWRIETSVDGWEEALQAHRAHHAEQNGSPPAAKVPVSTCKVDGCSYEAVAARGPYARLCPAHRLDKIASIAEASKAGRERIRAAAVKPPPATTSPIAPRPAARRALALPPAGSLTELAQAVDQAAATLEAARAAHDQALAELRAAIDRHASTSTSPGTDT